MLTISSCKTKQNKKKIVTFREHISMVRTSIYAVIQVHKALSLQATHFYCTSLHYIIISHLDLYTERKKMAWILSCARVIHGALLVIYKTLYTTHHTYDAIHKVDSARWFNDTQKATPFFVCVICVSLLPPPPPLKHGSCVGNFSSLFFFFRVFFIWATPDVRIA